MTAHLIPILRLLVLVGERYGMDMLRALNLTVWGALLLYMLPGAWSAARGKTVRHGDPMRLGVMATAFVMCGFNIRWLFFADNQTLWAALYVLAAADAVYIAFLAKAYGRGSHVG